MVRSLGGLPKVPWAGFLMKSWEVMLYLLYLDVIYVKRRGLFLKCLLENEKNATLNKI